MFGRWFSKRKVAAPSLHDLADRGYWATFRELPALPEWRVVNGVEHPVAPFQIIPADVFAAMPLLQQLEGRELPGWPGKAFDQRDFSTNGTWLPTTAEGQHAMEIYFVPAGQMPLGYSHRILSFISSVAAEYEKNIKKSSIAGAERVVAGNLRGLQNVVKMDFLFGEKRKRADAEVRQQVADAEKSAGRQVH